MATAYAAIVSVNHLLKEIKLHSFVEQLREIESLKEKTNFLQDYLEGYYSRGGIADEAWCLERRIADACYQAEDIIETYVNDCKNHRSKFNQVSEAIQKVIQDMDLITKEMVEIEHPQQPNDLTHVVHSTRPHPTMTDHDTIVRSDDRFIQIMDKITREESSLQIIPITGMGGIGKTTLAQNIYDNPQIAKYSDIRSRVTISQSYDIQQILSILLSSTNTARSDDYHDLGKQLHQYLSGRKYLILMDDLCDTEAWDKLTLFFPDNNNGSRIIVTTRLLDVASYVGTSSNNLQEMNLLDENESWSLLHRIVFVQEDCPLELEEVGKKIAKKCKRLPLSIVVIGGLLVKSKMTREFWEFVANNIDKVVNSEDSDCLTVLSLSYRQLPIHLQPCFLYLGIYPEDRIICVSELIKLWVAERFLKPNKHKTLEEVAEEYLKDLIERHLIMVNEWGSIGRMKTCRIHDILRDLCLRQAHKENFIFVIERHKIQDSLEIINGQRRVVIRQDPSHRNLNNPLPHALQSTSLVRSLTFDNPSKFPELPHFEFIRVLNPLLYDGSTQELDINLFNLRYLYLILHENIGLLSLVNRPWNLQTLIVDQYDFKIDIPSTNIWEMLHLRHLKGRYIYLLDPPISPKNELDDLVLENLQTLTGIVNLKCTEEILKRIPNVKKLGITYCDDEIIMSDGLHFSLHNLVRLQNLESLSLVFDLNHVVNNYFIKDFVFPRSLKKLAINGYTGVHYLEDIITSIGLLPHLEKLKLYGFSTREDEWNLEEGAFLNLKLLVLWNFDNLVYWTAESAHFPLLEHLYLREMGKLMDIPSDFGSSTTLQSITVYLCNNSVFDSVKTITDEQRSFGNEDFRLTIIYDDGEEIY